MRVILKKIMNKTIKYVENEINGPQIKPQKQIVLDNAKYSNSIIATFVAEKHIRDNNSYEAVVNIGSEDIEFVNAKPDKDVNGNKTFEITKLPKKDITITVVYSVEQHKLITNYYRYDPNSDIGHSNEVMNSKNASVKIGYSGESHELSIPDVLNENIDDIIADFDQAMEQV